MASGTVKDRAVDPQSLRKGNPGDPPLGSPGGLHDDAKGPRYHLLARDIRGYPEDKN